MKQKLFISFFSCSVCMLGYGQDTLKTLKEVKVSTMEVLRMKTLDLGAQTLTREQILLKQPQDVGAILQSFSGITLKSYGGLGGLKTISVRGLGSQHTGYVVDGFTVSNAQTGQVNLGQVQADNVEAISLSVGSKNGYLLPASAYSGGSLVSISTFENRFSEEPFQVRFASKVGSFGQMDNYFGLKFNRAKVFGSVFGKYRQASGNYAYSLQNGNQLYEGTRINNDLKDWYTGASLGFAFKNDKRLRIMYKTNGANQGLPGAVILYNSTANQRLTTQNHTVNTDFSGIRKKLSYRFMGTYNYDLLHYTDPSFLNNTGGISTSYTNQSYQLGSSFQRTIFSNFNLFGGIESRYNTLLFSTANSATPRRLHSFALAGCTWSRPQWTSEVQLSAQQVIEENNAGERAPNRLKFLPFVSIEKEEFGDWDWKAKAWYRHSFRMPSFNELYYNGIGNVKLKHEEADQFSAGFSAKPLRKKWKMEIVVNGFANRVTNQILAIPTKNLFVWSMQNIGRVNTLGYEERIKISKSIGPNWMMDATGNYTYQHSIDVSNPNSPSYKNQVAYIPLHTGNIDLSLMRKTTGVNFSTTLSSLRYSLMENVVANQVNGFAIFDISLFTKISLPKENNLRIQFSVKNIFNSSYAYIRYFVMPGRNYLITLNYAIH